MNNEIILACRWCGASFPEVVLNLVLTPGGLAHYCNSIECKRKEYQEQMNYLNPAQIHIKKILDDMVSNPNPNEDI